MAFPENFLIFRSSDLNTNHSSLLASGSLPSFSSLSASESHVFFFFLICNRSSRDSLVCFFFFLSFYFWRFLDPFNFISAFTRFLLLLNANHDSYISFDFYNLLLLHVQCLDLTCCYAAVDYTRHLIALSYLINNSFSCFFRELLSGLSLVIPLHLQTRLMLIPQPELFLTLMASPWLTFSGQVPKYLMLRL